jgi:hypothetical protein
MAKRKPGRPTRRESLVRAVVLALEAEIDKRVRERVAAVVRGLS